MKENANKISSAESIFWIIFAIAITVILLGFPHIFAWRFEGEWIPILDTYAVRGLWLIIIVWTALEIGAELFKIIEGRYTNRLMIAVVVSCAIQMIFVGIIFGTTNIANPEFVYTIESLDLGGLQTWLVRPDVGIMLVFMGILIWEIIEIVIKTHLTGKGE